MMHPMVILPDEDTISQLAHRSATATGVQDSVHVGIVRGHSKRTVPTNPDDKKATIKEGENSKIQLLLVAARTKTPLALQFLTSTLKWLLLLYLLHHPLQKVLLFHHHHLQETVLFRRHLLQGTVHFHHLLQQALSRLLLFHNLHLFPAHLFGRNGLHGQIRHPKRPVRYGRPESSE